MILLTAPESESRVESDVRQLSCERTIRWTAEARSSLQARKSIKNFSQVHFYFDTGNDYPDDVRNLMEVRAHARRIRVLKGEPCGEWMAKVCQQRTLQKTQLCQQRPMQKKQVCQQRTLQKNPVCQQRTLRYSGLRHRLISFLS